MTLLSATSYAFLMGLLGTQQLASTEKSSLPENCYVASFRYYSREEFSRRLGSYFSFYESTLHGKVDKPGARTLLKAGTRTIIVDLEGSTVESLREDTEILTEVAPFMSEVASKGIDLSRTPRLRDRLKKQAYLQLQHTEGNTNKDVLISAIRAIDEPGTRASVSPSTDFTLVSPTGDPVQGGFGAVAKPEFGKAFTNLYKERTRVSSKEKENILNNAKEFLPKREERQQWNQQAPNNAIIQLRRIDRLFEFPEEESEVMENVVQEYKKILAEAKSRNRSELGKILENLKSTHFPTGAESLKGWYGLSELPKDVGGYVSNFLDMARPGKSKDGYRVGGFRSGISIFVGTSAPNGQPGQKTASGVNVTILP